jgi:isocitrate dehydrogenase kinase/phosphatase
MTHEPTQPAVHEEIARAILTGFDRHYSIFRAAARRARIHFQTADWASGAKEAVDRIRFYDQRVSEVVAVLAERYPGLRDREELWRAIKPAYIGLLYSHQQPECAETFYNSVACRVLDRRYYRNDYIFTRPAVSTEYLDGDEPTYHCHYPATTSLRACFRQTIADLGLTNEFRDLHQDLRNLLRAFRRNLPRPFEPQPNMQVQVLSSPFFRNKCAYVVGRIINGHRELPFVIPILQDEGGKLFVDALLVEREHIGAVFSLARSYFMVEMSTPSAYVAFLARMMPGKPPSELYTAIGLQKQGKTLFYRDLLEHLKHSSDSFVFARGVKGMVMLVFTLPSFPYVFKVIRDWFDPPKSLDRKTVIDRYQLVKNHDRVGRLADTLEYRDVSFPLARFDPALLDELNRVCRSAFEIDGDQLVIHHLYIERRMKPLDLAFAEASHEEMHGLVVEYGRALQELASANIFPGDMLLKNFGVTRYGRVVFYDYDELAYLTDVHFRTIPKARTDEEELAAEPWFSVGPHDVFPEELPQFIFPGTTARRTFLETYPELARASYWKDKQERIRAGDQGTFFPYPESVRFGAG